MASCDLLRICPIFRSLGDLGRRDWRSDADGFVDLEDREESERWTETEEEAFAAAEDFNGTDDLGGGVGGLSKTAGESMSQPCFGKPIV